MPLSKFTLCFICRRWRSGRFCRRLGHSIRCSDCHILCRLRRCFGWCRWSCRRSLRGLERCIVRSSGRKLWEFRWRE